MPLEAAAIIALFVGAWLGFLFGYLLGVRRR